MSVCLLTNYIHLSYNILTMTARQRRLRRQQIDAHVSSVALSDIPISPRGGWVHAIREALGMSLGVFGGRLGISRQTAHQLEAAEANESISIKRLRSAAEALECELVIYLRPKSKLETIVNKRAREVAQRMVMSASHTMAMEDQAIPDSKLSDLIDETAEDLIDRADRSIWQWT